jgi:hypothetical protein
MVYGYDENGATSPLMHPQNHVPSLKIAFTRLDPQRHRVSIVRPDGSAESRDLETRSFLLHDLIHYAVESEAGVRTGFYGALAAGAGFAPAEGLDGERLVIEQIVGAFTGAQKETPPPAPESFVASVSAFIAAAGGSPPSWLTTNYVAAVRRRLREVEGQWRATPFGDTMRLEF